MGQGLNANEAWGWSQGLEPMGLEPGVGAGGRGWNQGLEPGGGATGWNQGLEPVV